MQLLKPQTSNNVKELITYAETKTFSLPLRFINSRKKRMLRKFSHIILSSLLLVSTIGMVVSKHYCGDSFISSSVFHQAESCCGDSDCCHNETSFYQVKDEFSAPAVVAPPVLAEIEILGHDLFAEILTTIPETEILSFEISDSPPPPKIQTVLSLKQQYLL